MFLSSLPIFLVTADVFSGAGSYGCTGEDVTAGKCSSEEGFLSQIAMDPGRLSYATVMYLFVTGRTWGETNKLIWQASVGSFTAAVAPQLAVDTFGGGWFAVALFIFFYTIVVLALPTEPLTKKFAMGICMNYLMYEANPQNVGRIERSVTFQVLLLGLWGCLVAFVLVLLPPFHAAKHAEISAQRAVDTIHKVVALLLHGYCEGLSNGDRSKLVKHFADMEVAITSMQVALDHAWYEPGSSTATARWSAVLDMIYKLRAELYGMQKALCDEEEMHYRLFHQPWALEAEQEGEKGLAGAAGLSQEQKNFVFDSSSEWHTTVMDELRDPAARVVLQSLALFTDVIQLITKQNTEIVAQVDATSDGTLSIEATRSNKAGQNLVRKRLKDRITQLLQSNNQGLEKTQEAVNVLHFHFASLREATKYRHVRNQIKSDQRAERDEVLIMFLFSLTGFAQQLLDFPEEYAHTMEEMQNKVGWCAADKKMVALQFQRKHCVAALKTAIAVTFATTVNATLLNYEDLAPVLVSYLMAGHFGSSFQNTSSRILGLLSGAILSVCFLIFSDCKKTDPACVGATDGNGGACGLTADGTRCLVSGGDCIYTAADTEYWSVVSVTAGFVLIVFGASYLRYTSPQQSYTGLTVALSASTVLVRECGDNLQDQYSLLRQIILACIALTAGEMGTRMTVTGAKNLQKKISDTLTECKTAFTELAQYSADQYYLAVDPDRYKPAEAPVDPRRVERSLWSVIPMNLHHQVRPHGLQLQPLWRIPAAAVS